MTVNEGLALQGLDCLNNLSDSKPKNFKAIGNAVNSDVILNISKNLILNKNYES